MREASEGDVCRRCMGKTQKRVVIRSLWEMSNEDVTERSQKKTSV